MVEIKVIVGLLDVVVSKYGSDESIAMMFDSVIETPLEVTDRLGVAPKGVDERVWEIFDFEPHLDDVECQL